MNEQLTSENLDTNLEATAALWTSRNTQIYDLLPADVTSLKERIEPREFSLWRYRAALPINSSSESWREVTMGEGATPLVDAGREWPGLKFKVEYAMPTLSFKDRGAVVMIAKAIEWGVDRIAADSSGNAGTAVSAYAARANIACDIFVPSSASAGKLIQMEMHGAKVHRVEGPREAATEEAQRFVADNDVFYASHIFNPYFHEGTKTMAYEIWEQLGFTAPDHMYLPVGHGTLVLGAYKGFCELFKAGLIKKMPILHAVQAQACAPIAAAFARGDSNVVAVEDLGTFAEGIAIVAPPRGNQILDAVRATGGDVMTLTDTDIKEARIELAAMGYFVEPTAAVTFAAYKKAPRSQTGPETTSVVPLCGAGLKAPKA